MRQKRAAEIRLAVVGGDLAFGWGVAAAETLPYFVRRLVALDIDQPGRPLRPVTAVNLAARGLPLAEYAAWIDRWAYLAPDVICILPDPEHHRVEGASFLPDRRSRFFATFGYSPILPLVVQEKGAQRHSDTLQAAAALLARLDPDAPQSSRANTQSVAGSIEAAVRSALRVATIGIVVIAPLDAGVEERSVAPADPRVRMVDLNRLPTDTSGLTLDGFDLSVSGHSWAADAVAPAVLELIHAAGAATR
jgi:hypothetical protein